MAKFRSKHNQSTPGAPLPKAPTGIHGLDEITGGGLPRGRPTLVCGSAGCGKTLLAAEFLIRGATEYDEPGVFLAFEESATEIAQNVRSLGFDLNGLAAAGKLLVDYVHIERSEIDETGEYDLEGLFVRLNLAIESVGAKRVVLDTIETLFAGLSNEAIIRAELRRLFRWLRDKGVTAIITGERGAGTLTRHGLEEYVSDCVILLDHRVTEQISTRRLRIVKYRGSAHGTNEYPFLIDESGFSVLPLSSIGLQHEVSSERVSTGIPRLDTMLGGAGVYRGSSVLVSGTAGTGKTSVAAHFAEACCRRGEKCMVFAFEESPHQLMRNMRSIGIDLLPYAKKGLLRIEAARPTLSGLEMHLARMHKLVEGFGPALVVVDPISNLIASGTDSEISSMLLRLIDFLKGRQMTCVLTSLTPAGTSLEKTDQGISSIIDTWLLLRDIESGGERNRALYVLKSRGMAHSHQLREFLLTDHGIELVDVYVGPEGVLTGSMRLAQQAQEAAEAHNRKQELDGKRRQLEKRRAALAAQMAALQLEFDADEAEMATIIQEEEARHDRIRADRLDMARSRQRDSDGQNPKSIAPNRNARNKARQS